MDMKQFHILHSETLMYYQIVEYELKVIYSQLLPGDRNANFREIEKMTLGQVVNELREKDRSSGHPWISEEDYRFLSKEAGSRNFWAHQNFLELMLGSDSENMAAFHRQSKHLKEDRDRLKSVARNGEEIMAAIIRNGKKPKKNKKK